MALYNGKEISIKSFNFNVLYLSMYVFVNSKDEEVGGYKGMLPFIDTDEFKQLNVGFGLGIYDSV
jgi:hypothetical protein